MSEKCDAIYFENDHYIAEVVILEAGRLVPEIIAVLGCEMVRTTVIVNSGSVRKAQI